jgi:hypothetical protein
MNPVLIFKYQTNHFMVEALTKFPPSQYCPTAGKRRKRRSFKKM